MLKPQMPNIPGVGVVTDTLDFVKNLWGSMGVPGASLSNMATPTLSVEELDKKIADLKAVEAWLNVNTSMVRGTIQALEVQRGTIATLRSMGAALADAVKQPGADPKSVLQAAPFASMLFAPPESAARSAPAADKGAGKGAGKAADQAADQGADGAPAARGFDPSSGLTNPAVWWNLLQDQFKQAVSTAMTSDAATKLAAASTGAAAELTKSVAKTLSRTAAPVPAAAAVKKAAARKAPAKPRAARTRSKLEGG
jgi:hypothetical protein